MHDIIFRSALQAIYVILFLGISLINAMADTGDTLVVTGSIVNLRAEPSLDGSILLRLARGYEVIEISRYPEWIEVSTKHSDALSGWIHASLLETVKEAEPDPERLAFEEFKQELNRLVNNYGSTPAMHPFSGVEHLEHGSIRLRANENWFALQQTQRESLLSEVFRIWRQHVKTGYSVMVEVVDQDKEQHMMIFR